jgi:hypothetical protein
MANVVNNRPDFLIPQNALGSRHSRRKNAVINNPLQLSIAIALHGRRTEKRRGRRHLLGKGDPRILPIKPMANHAVIRKTLAAGSDILRSRRQRVSVIFPANRDVGLNELGELRFHRSGLPNLAPEAHQNAREKAGVQADIERLAAHAYSSTTIIRFMLP